MSETDETGTGESRSPLAYEASIPVRIYDTDMLGVVNNVVYVRWLEDLRTGWCDRYLPLQEQMARGVAPVIVSIHIEYGTPVRFGDEVVGKVWVTPERVRMVVDTEIRANGSLSAKARQVVAMVRTDTLRPTRMPADLLRRYEEGMAGRTASEGEPT